MKIYFCGSIHGGRQDADLYAEIIQELKTNYGQVLTEFVGSETAAQDEANRGSRWAHDYCLHNLNACDVLVAEVTQPSLGVGYEIGRAAAMDKKILCLFRPSSNKSLSCMIDGLTQGDKSVVRHYEGQEYKEILKSFFASL